MAFLTIERDGGILTATMNQPETRNALTGNTAVQEFVQLCDDVRKDASVKVLILTGAAPSSARAATSRTCSASLTMRSRPT